MFDFWRLRGNGCRMLPMSSKKPEEMARWNSCGMSICSNCWFARNRFFLTSQYYIIVVNNAQQHLEPCHQHALNGFDSPEEDIHGHSACMKCQQCHTVSTYIALINKLPSAAKCCQVLPSAARRQVPVDRRVFDFDKSNLPQKTCKIQIIKDGWLENPWFLNGGF